MRTLDYGRDTKLKRKPLILVVALSILVLLGYAAWRRYAVPSGTPCRTLILAVDAATGAQLNPTIGGPAIEIHRTPST